MQKLSFSFLNLEIDPAIILNLWSDAVFALTFQEYTGNGHMNLLKWLNDQQKF